MHAHVHARYGVQTDRDFLRRVQWWLVQPLLGDPRTAEVAHCGECGEVAAANTLEAGRITAAELVVVGHVCA